MAQDGRSLVCEGYWVHQVEITQTGQGRCAESISEEQQLYRGGAKAIQGGGAAMIRAGTARKSINFYCR